MTDKYAVFGNPIKHSKSPHIHMTFAEETGEDIHYRSHKVEPDKFVDAAHSFFNNGGKGLNITLPFKTDAFNFADTLSDRATRAGAVNTLAIQDDGSIYGDNTDGIGLVRDICDNLGWQIEGKRLLILGAGGAVRGILKPIIKQKPASLVIANRTVAKAEALADSYADLLSMDACGFDALEGSKFDLIINGTSSGLTGDLPHLPSGLLADDGCCYDMVYGSEPTVFMRWGAENMAWALADGLGMLVEQAAESFCIWRGKRPSTRPIIDALRAELEANL